MVVEITLPSHVLLQLLNPLHTTEYFSSALWYCHFLLAECREEIKMDLYVYRAIQFEIVFVTISFFLISMQPRIAINWMLN